MVGETMPVNSTRSLHGLGLALRLLLGLDLVVAVLDLLLAVRAASVVDRAVHDPGSVTFGELTSLTQIDDALGVAWFCSYLTTGVVWLVWLRRARENVEEWSPQFQRSGPRATIWAWFVPVLNLFWPARIMRDILEDTERDRAESWSERRGQPLVTVWAVGFAAMAVSSVMVRVMGNDATVEDLGALSTATIFDAAITVVAVIPAVLVVGRLTEAQQRRIELDRYTSRAPVTPSAA